eukprot:CAMPEP_0180200256 /NCGR_PEP_ID=MMETSP0987-20121128/6140_1 /TAXON_ID=697907 /ORGANISM="non described non described, Strain CCMP2293" /LENGTH=131 /DNA_ID=CAMNT_0022155385 /DNA_START=163 /DNA_END=554 /DNA_ORIENTATION=-
MIARGEVGRDLSPGRVDTAATGSAACSEFAARLRTPVRSRAVASRSEAAKGKSPRRRGAAVVPEGEGGELEKEQFDDTEAEYVEKVIAKSAQRMVAPPRAPPPKPQSPLWNSAVTSKDGRAAKRSCSANVA